MRLWSMPSSGNSYKVRLLPALPGRDCGIFAVEAGSGALDADKGAGRPLAGHEGLGA